MKSESLGVSLTRLILVITILVSFGAILGAAGYLANNKDFVTTPPQASLSPVPTVIATPIVKDETADWQTYSNEEYGFEVKYPSVWSYNEGPLPYTFYFGEKNFPFDTQAGIWVTPKSNLKDFYQDKIQQNCKETFLIGKAGWICEGEQYSETERGTKTGYIVKHIYIEVENNGKFYFFSISAIEQNSFARFKIFNQIVSTFKFIEKDETADWKIYRNEEYGFEVRYPRDWEKKESQGNDYGEQDLLKVEVELNPYPRKSDFKTYGITIFDNDQKMDYKNICKFYSDSVHWQKRPECAQYQVSNKNYTTLSNIDKVIIFKAKQPYTSAFVAGFAKDNLLFEFVEYSGYENPDQPTEMFNDILSTFKFIDKNSSFSCGTSIVTDIDNNVYNTVQIGSQCWLKENLKVTKNPVGEAITRYCYDNDPKICETDGGLYDWNTAMNNSTVEGAQGICPNGWHVPKDSEWYILENYLKDEDQSCDKNRNEWDCDQAGTKLKLGGDSRFYGVLAGGRDIDYSFDDRGTGAYFWSSSESGTNAWYRFLYSGYTMVDRSTNGKAYGFSVRCLKD